jgi:protein tyrosine phosphatase (PTP) superfamily phosphohydrolase (DUF442 family)
MYSKKTEMTNVQLGKIRRLLGIAGLSWSYIASMFRGVTREDVRRVARSIKQA